MVPSPDLQQLAHSARIADLHWSAARDPRHADRREPGPGADVAARQITIRPGRADDRSALVHLAELDCADLPPEPLLVAEIDGAVRALLSRRTGAVIADPFHPTTAAIELLRLRAAQLDCGSRSRPRRILMSLIHLGASDHDTAPEAT